MEDERKIELADEAIALIKEYGELSIERRGGENPIESVRCSEDRNTIFVKEVYDKEREFKLTEISKVFKGEVVFGNLDEDFASLRKAYNIQTKFDKMKKDEFINYIGSTYYGQLRCKKIYEKLERIEVDAVTYCRSGQDH